MSTKNNPGTFDCYQKAEPDEPMFVLLGRDKHAPTLVWLWCVLRELDGEKPEKIKEAQECAVSMMAWLADHQGKAVGVGQAALAAVLELIRAANAKAELFKNEESTVETVRAFFCQTKFGGE